MSVVASKLFSYFTISPVYPHERICYENLRISPEQIDPNASKDEVIEQLLQYVRQQMLVSDLLNLLRERKPETFNKFGSYYRVPRRPSRGMGQDVRSRRWESILAVFLGATVTILGILVFLLVDSIVKTFDSTGIISSIALVGFFPLGDFVGSIVVKVLKGRRGERAGRLAVISYLIGWVALPVGLFMIIFSIILVLAILAARTDPIGALQLIGSLIITALKIVLYYLNPLNNLSSTFAIVGGSRFAYDRARWY